MQIIRTSTPLRPRDHTEPVDNDKIKYLTGMFRRDRIIDNDNLQRASFELSLLAKEENTICFAAASAPLCCVSTSTIHTRIHPQTEKLKTTNIQRS